MIQALNYVYFLGGGGNFSPKDPKTKEVLEPKPSELKSPKMGGIVKNKKLIDMASRGKITNTNEIVL